MARILEPVSTASSCSAFESSGSIYAIGWSPTSNTGTACGSGVPAPQSAAQVFNFLKVTVNGGTVTVTPTNAAGQTFDVQSYTYSLATATVIDTPPPALTNNTSATIAFHSTGGPTTFTCSLDGATATACTSPVTYTGLAQGAHTVTVTGAGASPATAHWTVDTTKPSVPAILTSGAVSSTQVALTWSTSTDNTGVTGYDVYRNGVLVTTSPVTTTSYTDTTASPAATYQYTVSALDGAGNASAQSSPATVTTPTGPSGPSLVQTASSSTAKVTLPVPSTPGDLLVLSAGVYTGASHPITAVSDGKNTWIKVGAYHVAGANSDGEMWYSDNATSVSSVTVTTGATAVALRLQDFNGIATTGVLDGSNGTAGDATAASSGTATAVGSNDLAVGFIAGHSTGQAITVTSPGYTAQPQQTTTSPSTASVETAYQDLSAPGSQSFTGSFPSTMYWASGLALFKAGTPPPPPGDFTITATPSSGTVTAGASVSTAISTTAVGTPQLVALSASGLPAAASVSFTPQSLTAGGSGSTMQVTTSPSTPAGTYTVTVTGTGTSAVHSTSFSLVVQTPPAITSPNTATFTVGVPGSFTVTTTGSPTAGLSEAGALPNGVTFTDQGNGTALIAGTATGVSSTVIDITAGNKVGSPATQGFTLNVDPVPSDFSLSASPTSANVTAGAAVTSTVTAGIASGAAEPVTLSASGGPAGTLLSFSPPTVTSGGSGSTLTVTPPSSAPAGTYTITVTGTASTTHSTPFAITVQTAPAITSSAGTTFTQGVVGAFTVTATGSPTPGLSENGALPSGVTFTDNGNGTATLTGNPATGSAASYPVTITATNVTGVPASQSFTLSVNPPVVNDFSMSATPNGGTVTAGNAVTSAIGTAVTSGSAQSVALSAIGLPAGATVSFNPQTVTAGSSSTMTITTGPAVTPGPYTVTVTGTGSGGSPVHTVTFDLTVDAPSPGPRLVQTASGSETASSTALSGSFSTATTAGDLLVLSASEYNGATNHITSVTDNAGNKWTSIGSYNVSGHNSNGEMWYSANAAPATTVTVHNGSAAFVSFEVQEFAGVATSVPLDVATGASNTGTTAGSGTATSTVADELAVGFVAGHNNAQAITVTAPGYTHQTQQTTTGSIATVVTGYQVLGSPGAQSFGGTFGTTMYWAAGIAIFKPA